MSTMDGRAFRPGTAAGREAPSGYMISVYTSLRDEDAACELAARISEGLAGEPEVHAYSTTVAPEADPRARRQVFDNVVPRRPSRATA